MKRLRILAGALLDHVAAARRAKMTCRCRSTRFPLDVMKIAADKLPGVKFDSAYKETKDGKEVFELRGKTKEGKIRDVEVTADGEVLEVD